MYQSKSIQTPSPSQYQFKLKPDIQIPVYVEDSTNHSDTKNCKDMKSKLNQNDKTVVLCNEV
ncbi:hypothetical protein AMTRI_Chr02g219270 [Amborella trichopoda]